MALNPEIADALRGINDQIGDDFESSVAEFEYTPSAPSEPEPHEGSRFSGISSAAIRRVMLVVLFSGAAGAVAIVGGPTIASWFDDTDPAPSMAMVDEDAEPTQRVVVDGDTMYLEGLVPDQEVSDVLESAAVEAVGRDRVVNNFEISEAAIYDPDRPIQLSVADPVLFETGAASLDEQYRPLIDLAVDLLEAEPSSTLRITGHTDDVGPEDKNLALSERRANAVAQLVVDHGIDRERLTVEGRGETEPIDTNETPEGRAVNRRVEFSILGVFGN